MARVRLPAGAAPAPWGSRGPSSARRGPCSAESGGAEPGALLGCAELNVGRRGLPFAPSPTLLRGGRGLSSPRSPGTGDGWWLLAEPPAGSSEGEILLQRPSLTWPPAPAEPACAPCRRACRRPRCAAGPRPPPGRWHRTRGHCCQGRHGPLGIVVPVAAIHGARPSARRGCARSQRRRPSARSPESGGCPGTRGSLCCGEPGRSAIWLPPSIGRQPGLAPPVCSWPRAGGAGRCPSTPAAGPWGPVRTPFGSARG